MEGLGSPPDGGPLGSPPPPPPPGGWEQLSPPPESMQVSAATGSPPPPPPSGGPPSWAEAAVPTTVRAPASRIAARPRLRIVFIYLITLRAPSSSAIWKILGCVFCPFWTFTPFCDKETFSAGLPDLPSWEPFPTALLPSAYVASLRAGAYTFRHTFPAREGAGVPAAKSSDVRSGRAEPRTGSSSPGPSRPKLHTCTFELQACHFRGPLFGLGSPPPPRPSTRRPLIPSDG